MKKIKLATVFSGIGAIEEALKQMNIKYDILFACDNGERILPYSVDEIEKSLKTIKANERQQYIKDLYNELGKENYVKQSYFANYNILEENWYEDIRFLDAKKYKNKIDLIVGGSPCQSFSVNGKRAGLKDVRGTLFYDYARIVKESKPKVFIYENVKGMLTHDNGKTWKIVKSVFKNIGYDIYIKQDVNGKEKPILNSKDFGIPQNRDRIFIIGFNKKLEHKNFEFPKEEKLKTKVSDFLEKYVDSKYYLGKKGFEFVTTHPSRAQVNRNIMRCQKANQQFNWNGDFIFEEYESVKNRLDVLEKAYVSKWNGKYGVTRKFTPRECLRLMGFSDDFKIVVKDEVMYRQAGNSIVVNILIALMESIIDTGVLKKC